MTMLNRDELEKSLKHHTYAELRTTIVDLLVAYSELLDQHAQLSAKYEEAKASAVGDTTTKATVIDAVDPDLDRWVGAAKAMNMKEKELWELVVYVGFLPGTR